MKKIKAIMTTSRIMFRLGESHYFEECCIIDFVKNTEGYYEVLFDNNSSIDVFDVCAVWH